MAQEISWVNDSHGIVFQLRDEKVVSWIYVKKKDHMETNKKGFRTALCIFVGALLCSCSPVIDVKYIPNGPRFPRYTGKIAVFWKEHGIPIEPDTYDFIGTISGQSNWCGTNKAKFYTDLQNYLINEAGKYGGNGIILHCGELGSTGECYCYGDIIRFKK
jgi:hypothetical protein